VAYGRTRILKISRRRLSGFSKSERGRCQWASMDTPSNRSAFLGGPSSTPICLRLDCRTSHKRDCVRRRALGEFSPTTQQNGVARALSAEIGAEFSHLNSQSAGGWSSCPFE